MLLNLGEFLLHITLNVVKFSLWIRLLVRLFPCFVKLF